MKRIKLHPRGPEVSAITAGMWRMDQWNLSTQELTGWIERAVELGITTFDHADIYGMYTGEELFGRAIKQTPSIRKNIEIVTKCGICLVSGNRGQNSVKHYNTSAKHITGSVEQSLRNFGTDYIDLLLIHRPDPLMEPGETASAIEKLIAAGKVKYAGVSNFSPSQFDLLQNRLTVPLVTNQVECSLLHTSPLFDGTFDHALKHNYSPMLWSPLGGGQLFSGGSEIAIRVRTELENLTEKYNADIDQLAFAWLLMHPARPVPVTGTRKTDRIAGAAGSAKISLNRQDWFKLLRAATGKDVL